MLTEVMVVEEERRVILSTVRAFGAVRKFVGGSKQWRRSSAKGQKWVRGRPEELVAG